MFQNASRFYPLAIVALLLSILLIEPAAAQSLGGAETTLNTIITALTGNIARLLATIACIIIGVTWMFGLVDLRIVGFFVIGAIIIFGAKDIVGMIAH